MSEIDFEQARFNMIEQQIRPWEVLDQRVLDVIAQTPRENFVPPRYRKLAFADVRIPLAHAQFMMNPNVEARLLQALSVESGERILEVGTGSAYLTACLARLGREVVSVDIFPEFTENAFSVLRSHAIGNVRLHTGDACRGWGEQQYDVIALTGSLPEPPGEMWLKQLAIGGRLFVIIGESPVMEALLITRSSEQDWLQDSLFETEIPGLINSATPVEFQF